MIRFSTLAPLAVFLSGCSIPAWVTEPFQSPASSEALSTQEPVRHDLPSQPPTNVPVEEIAVTPQATDVEIVWETTESEVEYFVVRWGSSGDQLANEERVPASAARETPRAPNTPTTYRHILRNVPTKDRLFVAIAAERDGVVSAPSLPREVPPLAPQGSTP